MSQVKQYEKLQKKYTEIDNKVKTLLKPLTEERNKKFEELEKWWSNEYSKIEPNVDKLYEEQRHIEDELSYLEGVMKECEHCGNYVDKFDKEAEENGFDYCEACAPSIDRCEPDCDCGEEEED